MHVYVHYDIFVHMRIHMQSHVYCLHRKKGREPDQEWETIQAKVSTRDTCAHKRAIHKVWSKKGKSKKTSHLRKRAEVPNEYSGMAKKKMGGKKNISPQYHKGPGKERNRDVCILLAVKTLSTSFRGHDIALVTQPTNLALHTYASARCRTSCSQLLYHAYIHSCLSPSSWPRFRSHQMLQGILCMDQTQ